MNKKSYNFEIILKTYNSDLLFCRNCHCSVETFIHMIKRFLTTALNCNILILPLWIWNCEIIVTILILLWTVKLEPSMTWFFLVLGLVWHLNCSEPSSCRPSWESELMLGIEPATLRSVPLAISSGKCDLEEPCC